MSTLITYKPQGIDLEAAQAYYLTLKNQSTQDWVFYVYQTMQKQTKDMLSLAWFATPYPIAPGDEIEFQWFIAYNFVWGDTGQLKPGITYKARGPRDANPDTLNLTTFGYSTSGAPTLTDPSLDSSNKGSLVISDLGNIPNKQFSVGIGMSGVGTFVEQAGPNLKHIFTPTPIYWVAAGTQRKVGDVLDIQTLTQTKSVSFPVGEYALTLTLDESNQWKNQPELALSA